MTREEVVAEVMAHLAGRTSPSDWLAPLANFYAMLSKPDRHYSTMRDALLHARGGPEAIAAHSAARRDRQAAYEAELAAASAAGRPLAAIAHAYGRHSSSAYVMAEKLGLKASRRYIDRSRLVEAAKPGMTITELAKAAGYNPGSLRNWVKYGHLEQLFVLRKAKGNVFRIAKVRRAD